MDTKFWKLNPDGHCQEFTVDWPAEPEYKDLKPLFQFHGIDFFERVRVAHPFKNGEELGNFNCYPTDMIVDEDGHAKGFKYNWRATMFYLSGQLVRGFSPRNLSAASPIVGPALLFDRPVIF